MTRDIQIDLPANPDQLDDAVTITAPGQPSISLSYDQACQLAQQLSEHFGRFTPEGKLADLYPAATNA